MSGPSTSLAVVATSCRYPDAASPLELWANVVEGRRSFRTLPPQRLDIASYAAESVGEFDSITRIRAGLLTDWKFDRARFRVPEKTFMVTDLTHWLALELAADCLEQLGGDAGFARARTAVVVANTMAGEFSRAALLRLRLPFLADLLDEACGFEALSSETAIRIRARFVDLVRSRFPDPNEDSLAGGLANTIAGRIANHFDFGGGAYSVDGACASSLVAIADAANLLVSGQADMAVVTAVDLSLDPFELVGFSRNGALANDEMFVFDKRANGFWPGEGGGCAVLMRERDAHRQGLPVICRILGWGLSTDGAGGLTRPTSEGQINAYRRAYAMAAVDPAEVSFIEAHGTGTAVGDPIEVRALAALRGKSRTPLPIGSIKANIGHTKAAAGLAGLIKAIEALRHGIVPVHVGCQTPHPVFAEVDGVVQPALTSKAIDDCRPAVAGVSSFGFGGINAHVVIGQAATTCRPNLPLRAPPVQDAELFLFAGDNVTEVVAGLDAYQRRAQSLSMAELTDAAARAAVDLTYGDTRVAIVASSGPELAERLSAARDVLLGAKSPAIEMSGLFTGRKRRTPRIGFVFPGQAAPCRPGGGIWRDRFACSSQIEARLEKYAGSPTTATEVAQPVIVASSLAALTVLHRLGITAGAAAGHSLGEITALAWAGALTDTAAIDLASARGSTMARHGLAGGGMLRVALTPDDATRILSGCGVCVACRNGPADTVVAGPAEAIAAAAQICAARRIEASRLPVSHAFHSPAMAPAAGPLREVIKTFEPEQPSGQIISTITGAPLTAEAPLGELLVDQLTQPVLFDDAVSRMAGMTDIFVEVGPGQGLTRLLRDRGLIATSIDAGDESLKALLAAAGALFVAGVDIRARALFEDRPVRAFDPAHLLALIESPCGSRTERRRPIARAIAPPVADELASTTVAGDPLTVVLSVVATETGLDKSSLGAEDRFLDALHLNSLAVARIVRAAAKALGARVPAVPTEFANATPRLLAEALAELRDFADQEVRPSERVGGVRKWVRTYAAAWETGPVPLLGSARCEWSRMMIGVSADPDEHIHDKDGLLIHIKEPLTPDVAERLVELVAESARRGTLHLSILHGGLPIASFARSVAREGHFRSVRIVDLAGADSGDPRVEAVLSADIDGYYEARLAGDGRMERPTLIPSSPVECPQASITSDDVVVVVGGGRGITAECALRLAPLGPAVILVGRTPPDDAEVAATLDRAKRKGMRCRYVQADILESEAFRTAVSEATNQFGPATVLIYAPAVNEPRRITEIDCALMRRTLAPKTLGLQTALEVLAPALRHLVTFGSIIGRIGLEGEAHYALANAMQTAATQAWAAAAPGRAALAIEWSLWGGAGMGERLGTIERLESQGVDALSIDGALDAFDGLLAGNATGSAIVTSRFGPPPALSLGAAELPIMRFLDQPLVHYPGVELVVETSISQGRDPYLVDHAIDGVATLPGVIGLEAMAQSASALMALGDHVNVSRIAFARALQIREGADLRVRIAALRTGDRVVEACLFAADDNFAVPCMHATFSAGFAEQAPRPPMQAEASIEATSLYGALFFGSGRFCRVARFERIDSRRVQATLGPDPGTKWFGAYEPDGTVLWDPGAADASLHALQAAVPHRRVIPVSVQRIAIDRTANPPIFISAVERTASSGTYVFDIIATDEQGRTAYRWECVTFRAVGTIDIFPVLSAAPLLSRPYLERIARERLGDDTIAVAVVHGSGGSRDSRRASALQALGATGKLERRGDGRPLRIEQTGSISLSHGDEISIAVTSDTPIGCDIEAVAACKDTDLEDLRRHVAFEVCRKLGRRPDPAFDAPAAGSAALINDVVLTIAELPTPSGPHAVGFGCLREPAVSAVQPFTFPISEAPP